MAQEGEEQRSSSSVTEEGEEEEPEMSAKRRRNHDSDAGNQPESGDLPSPKRMAKAHDVLFRIVVPSRHVGRVIGKGGSRIGKIREETRATIKIANAVARHEERVIIINSRDDDSKISDAENALYQIARAILKENDNDFEASTAGAGHAAANTIRLLIAGSQAGSLIGMSGQNIEKLRNSSGATITILAQNQFPLCASAHESDRLMQISGDVPEVLKALEEIGYHLRENPPRKVISISPTYNFSSNQQYAGPASADHVTSEMMISETLVGGLIGKCGSNISKIRLESGAMIKVAGGRGEQQQRPIHFSGSAQQVALAKKLVDEYVYSQSIQ
ncbi:hypothetical protein HHK36_028036 [Tetracentron sinense]|uniref:K Homology domain-containing protein n=1 Tax=Tetracentron sinense TaxID=13715 RepID=A0A835D4Y8_TETSI|nr:hypothetical protein HHK36_028036 [Tetracentron sinense]